ncbi:hypothetical protein QO206_13390 [Leeuwenhoekiella aequorea]|uniref:hypothetical protein n=1 Tax=Leeuwenhoekiella aequorea TaxID=283736 RepID=UPI00352F2610|tara:strand:- start:1233 stop:1505 length:273 start_codon:yes stop_codon:yes gene_type:complete
MDSIEEFNEVLNRLKNKGEQNKLGKSLQIKLRAFLEVENIINSNIPDANQIREVLLKWEEQKYFDYDWVKNKERVSVKIDEYLINNLHSI